MIITTYGTHHGYGPLEIMLCEPASAQVKTSQETGPDQTHPLSTNGTLAKSRCRSRLRSTIRGRRSRGTFPLLPSRGSLTFAGNNPPSLPSASARTSEHNGERVVSILLAVAGQVGKGVPRHTLVDRPACGRTRRSMYCCRQGGPLNKTSEGV